MTMRGFSLMKTMMRQLARSRMLWVLLLFGATLLVIGGYVEAERSQPGVLMKARGDVQYMKVGTVAWVTAHERQRVNQGDRIRTGRTGEAVVRLSERNFIAIKENAEITINTSRVRTEADPNNRVMGIFPARIAVQDVEVGLARGRSVSVMRGLQSNSNYRVRTPVATAGVRGTTFLADVLQAAGGATNNFGCLDGGVNVAPNTPGAFSPVSIGPGDFFSLGVSPSGAIVGGAPTVIPAPSTELTNMASSFVDIRSNAPDFTSGASAPTSQTGIQGEQVLVNQVNYDYQY